MSPSAASCFSTTVCVAMPAWSVPGIQTAFLPRIRSRRMMTSWMVLSSACPTWSDPVTFGGGMTMLNGSPGSSGSAWKRPAASQSAYSPASTADGSYAFGSSLGSDTAAPGGASGRLDGPGG